MKKEEIGNRKKQALETKNKLYKIANQLFRERGFEDVSVDSIVAMAGVSKGTFYVHFNSKDALIAELINDFVNEMDLDYKSYLDSLPANTNASEILISLTGKIADIITCKIGYDNMKAVYKAHITKTVNTEAVMSYNRDLYKMFNDVISKGVHQGEFRTDISPDVITKHCIMALRGLSYEWCIRYPDFNLRDQTLEHFQILLTGLKMQ